MQSLALSYTTYNMGLNLFTSVLSEELEKLIKKSNKAVVCCHESPDGDAVGSMLAWGAFLENQGKQVTMIVPDAFPDFLAWLPGQERMVRFDKHMDRCLCAITDADIVFCLDFNTPSRVGNVMMTALQASNAPRVLIDHHLDPDVDARFIASFSSLSSTSEIVFRLINQLAGIDAINKQMATCIYCGMMTDTGNFTYSADYPEIYTIISLLLTKGINKDRIYRNVYHNYSSWALRFRGHIICQKMNVIEDCHASFFTVTKEEMTMFHFIKGDLEGLVNEPLRIKGIKLSISLREDDRQQGLIWVSLRSVGSFDCNQMAAQCFSGGGHLNASGGRYNGTIEEAANYTRKAIEMYKDKLIAASK